MSDAARRLGHWQGAGIALAFFMGMAAQAQARGIVADEGTSQSLSSPISFDGLTVYAYGDGAISIGTPLPNTLTPSDPSTFGNNFFAAGLFDYSGPNYSISMQEFTSNISSPKLSIIWAFTDTAAGSPLGASSGVFGIQLVDNQDGTFSVFSGVGVSTAVGTWGHDYLATGYCDAYCLNGPDGNDPDGEVGVYLPTGAEVGFEYNGTVFDAPAAVTNTAVAGTDPPVFSYDNYSFTFTPQVTSTVPEPSTWAVMAFGLLSLGIFARRGRKRIGRAA